jgi:FAD/FMN-containing dehydrogenase
MEPVQGIPSSSLPLPKQLLIVYSVGVGGHVVGGGYGYSSHTKGLALDNLVEATVVLANSTVVTTSTAQNSDLFWAIRGAGGGSFGVITNYKFQTFAAPTANTVFSYTISGWGQAQAIKVHAALQAYTASTKMPAEMNLRLFVTAGSLQLEGLYYGSQSAFQSAIAPFSQAIGGASWQTSTQGWIQSLNTYAYMSLTQPLNYDIVSFST